MIDAGIPAPIYVTVALTVACLCLIGARLLRR